MHTFQRNQSKMLRTVLIIQTFCLISISASWLKESEDMLDLSELDLPSLAKSGYDNYLNGHSRSNIWNPADRDKTTLYQESQECGIAAVSPTSRIMKGRDANPGEFPWFVQVVTTNPRYTREVLCGGSIISKEYILTAANCADPADEQFVVTGPSFDPPSSKLPVAESILHPKFVHKNNDSYDIALLRLVTPLEWGDDVRPICLPNAQEGELKIGANLSVVGRGMTESEKIVKGMPKTTDIPLASFEQCAQRVGARRLTSEQLAEIRRELEPEYFCAGKGPEVNATKDVELRCDGDTGGPASFRRVDKENQWVILGISSRGCRVINGYQLFTKVTNYLEWIISIIGIK